MSPAALALIVGLVEEAIKDTPALISELQTIFNNANPTADDWAALRARVLSDTFASLAPDAPLS